jgi:adenine-specific DNA-methyltransferase
MTAKPNNNYEDLRREELIALIRERDTREAAGLRLNYEGQTPPWQIIRRVKPRRQRIEKKLSFGAEEDQSNNLIIEGENLQAMVSLYKYRGQVDLVLADPPYNTGQDFRYNDKWEEDPNDPELGELVPKDDGSRHSKWLRFMVPRLWMMREMLKPSGVLAICIDHRELFRLGLILDQMFGENNRLAIINWQKTTPKNDAKHVSTTTEYVLVYAKNEDRATTALLERKETTNRRFNNPDNDPLGAWQWGDLTAATPQYESMYRIQSPFSGRLYDSGNRSWAYKKKTMKEWLELWGIQYQELDTEDGRAKALVLKGWSPKNSEAKNAKIIASAAEKAKERLSGGNWPILYWGQDGMGAPAKKHHIQSVKSGAVPVSFWVDSEDEPIDLESTSWRSAQSGRSREGIEELAAVLGPEVRFETVKPLKLFTKIIQIWCPVGGILLDPFAGTGTTAHAVLDLNQQTDRPRRFIMIEQGRSEKGDPYARTLTTERIRRVITGQWAEGRKPAVAGGFRFTQLSKAVDGEAVLALEREEMIDLLLTSHWDQSERSSPHLRRQPAGTYKHLFAINARGEGYFLVWNTPGHMSVLNRETFRTIAEEAKAAKLKPPYHVYARVCTYSGPNIEFYQIPNRILEKLGFNEAAQPFSGAEGEVGS